MLVEVRQRQGQGEGLPAPGSHRLADRIEIPHALRQLAEHAVRSRRGQGAAQGAADAAAGPRHRGDLAVEAHREIAHNSPSSSGERTSTPMTCSHTLIIAPLLSSPNPRASAVL